MFQEPSEFSISSGMLEMWRAAAKGEAGKTIAYLDVNPQGPTTKFPRIKKDPEVHQSRYKHGKQMRPISFEDLCVCVEKAQSHLTEEQNGYIWLLYYCGVRKSEGVERVVDDVEITELLFTIDFHKRKKGGAKVDPLKLPRAWPGVEILVKLTEKARAKRAQRKLIYYQEMRERRSRVEKNHWIFPNIQSTEAWRIAKRVLGPEFYPHFLRLNRLTEIGKGKGSSSVRLKSFSGIKSIRSLEFYLGIDQAEQDQALELMDEHIRAGQQKDSGEKDGEQ